MEIKMEEIWKPVVGFEGRYVVSNIGNVKSLNYNKTGKIKQLHTYFHIGYEWVGLSKNGFKKQYAIHRLVAEAFIPNPYNKPQVDHINTIRHDNRVENLRWVTNKENTNNVLSKINYSKAKKGQIVSEETRLKISQKLKGRKRPKEVGYKISQALKQRKR